MILEMIKSKMWSGAWNKVNFGILQPIIYLASTVSRAVKWWSRGPGFNPYWGQFLAEFILLFPLLAFVNFV